MIAAWLGVNVVQAQTTPELRGWWADTFHAALRTPTEVESLVADARAANFNAVFVEVRKRGDAYYESRFEPKASDVQAGFDPLAYLITRAHDTNAGTRIEVHAWIVTYNIWNRQLSPPPQADHPYRLHPDWLTESFDGEKWDGSNYAFDPGHPAVQEHTFNVAMDLVSRYDVDGLHLDYIRYAGREWGYNPVAVARFNATTGSTGRPAPDDSGWMQWRRDQVTALVRRVYLAAAAIKPQMAISAATITWTPTATNFPTWLKAAAWSDVLQDWRGWMEEGILDLNIPMAYFRHETHATAWAEWSRFAKSNRFQRHAALGVAGYLNTSSNTIVQMRSARLAVSPAIPKADGVVVYSFAAPIRDNAPRANFITALTRPSTVVSGPPIFEAPAPSPTLPWKTDEAFSGIGGRVTDAHTGQPIQGAQVELVRGPANVQVTDANGVFGRLFAARPAGLIVAAAGYATQMHPWPDGVVGVLATNFTLQSDVSSLRALDLRVTPGRAGAVVSWRTEIACRGRVLIGLGAPAGNGGNDADARVDQRHAAFITGLDGSPPDDPAEYWVRVVNELPGIGTNYSHAVRIVPAMWPPVANEWSVRRTGSWEFIEAANAGRHAGSWRAATTAAEPTAVAVWSLRAEVSGLHDLSFRHHANTGSFVATYDIQTSETNRTITVTHPRGGPLTGKLAGPLNLRRGERVQVRLTNRAPAGQTFVAACQMAIEYRAGQDPPPAGAVPRWWAEHFFPEPPDPRDDADSDGYSNEAEHAFGTDPTNPDSNLRMRLEPSPDGGWRMIFWPRAGGGTPKLERTSDLLRDAWEEVRIESSGTRVTSAGEAEVLLPPGEAEGQFYRLKAQPPDR